MTDKIEVYESHTVTKTEITAYKVGDFIVRYAGFDWRRMMDAWQFYHKDDPDTILAEYCQLSTDGLEEGIMRGVERLHHFLEKRKEAEE